MDPSLMRSWHHTAVVPFCKTLSFSLAQIQEIVLLSLMKWKQRDLSLNMFSDIQFSSVAQSCPNLCNPVNRSTPGFPVQHQLPEFPRDPREPSQEPWRGGRCSQAHSDQCIASSCHGACWRHGLWSRGPVSGHESHPWALSGLQTHQSLVAALEDQIHSTSPSAPSVLLVLQGLLSV